MAVIQPNRKQQDTIKHIIKQKPHAFYTFNFGYCFLLVPQWTKGGSENPTLFLYLTYPHQEVCLNTCTPLDRAGFDIRHVSLCETGLIILPFEVALG